MARSHMFGAGILYRACGRQVGGAYLKHRAILSSHTLPGYPHWDCSSLHRYTCLGENRHVPTLGQGRDEDGKRIKTVCCKGNIFSLHSCATAGQNSITTWRECYGLSDPQFDYVTMQSISQGISPDIGRMLCHQQIIAYLHEHAAMPIR